MLRIGHKGADLLAPGNTPTSFRAAVEAGVDAIELDVLRPRADFADGSDWRRAPAGPATAGGPLVIAHDWADAERREPLTLAQGLDLFAAPPLDGVRINLDLKLAGREDEIVAAIAERDLLGRAMVSTMEIPSIEAVAELEPRLARGWTLPKVGRDWAREPRPAPDLPRRLGGAARPAAGPDPRPRAPARRLGGLGLPPADHRADGRRRPLGRRRGHRLDRRRRRPRGRAPPARRRRDLLQRSPPAALDRGRSAAALGVDG